MFEHTMGGYLIQWFPVTKKNSHEEQFDLSLT